MGTSDAVGPTPIRPTRDSRTIHNTWIRRFLAIAAVKILGPFMAKQSVVVFLPMGICVKSGIFTRLSEATTMKFISENTTIPVPKVYCSFIHNGRVYIVMERIQGEMLARVWRTKSEDSRAKILGQLKNIVDQLRAIPHPSDLGIANVDGGPLYDGRLRSEPFGPFDSVQDFHRFLRRGLKREPGYELEIDQMMELQDGPWPSPVLTHADLSSLNILVCGDEVVGILDWETAGWYPSYWEYTTANQVNLRNHFWKDVIDQFLDPMPRELVMDSIRLKHFGDV